MTTRAQIDPIRSITFDSISGSYAAVGTALTNPARLICFNNNTQGDLLISRDGSTDELFVAAGSFKLFDVSANHRVSNRSDLVFETGTQWYVKLITATVSGKFYIEVIYGT